MWTIQIQATVGGYALPKIDITAVLGLTFAGLVALLLAGTAQPM
jgi:hypothetical protein